MTTRTSSIHPIQYPPGLSSLMGPSFSRTPLACLEYIQVDGDTFTKGSWVDILQSNPAKVFGTKSHYLLVLLLHV